LTQVSALPAYRRLAPDAWEYKEYIRNARQSMSHTQVRTGRQPRHCGQDRGMRQWAQRAQTQKSSALSAPVAVNHIDDEPGCGAVLGLSGAKSDLSSPTDERSTLVCGYRTTAYCWGLPWVSPVSAASNPCAVDEPLTGPPRQRTVTSRPQRLMGCTSNSCNALAVTRGASTWIRVTPAEIPAAS